MEQVLFESVVNWGLGVTLAIILVLMFRKFINRILDGVEKDREMYVHFINNKDTTINNHINHLNESIVENSKQVRTHRSSVDAGFDKVVDAIKNQTEIIKMLHREDKKSSNGN